jgi:hypothetical protein
MAREPKSEPEAVEFVPRGDDAVVAADELPVVARLVVEIRSDGRRTIARGAMEDATLGHKVAIEARGDTPLGLAMSLAKAMVGVPSLARTAARALLPGRRRR